MTPPWSHLSLVLVGRRDGPAERDGELGRDQRLLLVVRDERVQRVEEDLMDDGWMGSGNGIDIAIVWQHVMKKAKK